MNSQLLKAFKKISLPAPGKPRYYMTQDELAWVDGMLEQYLMHTERDDADAEFFKKLYQYGVFIGTLSENCSPAGLRSYAGRRGGKRKRQEGEAEGGANERKRQLTDVPVGGASGGGTPSSSNAGAAANGKRSSRKAGKDRARADGGGK